MNKANIVFCFLLIIFSFPEQAQAQIKWPGNKKAVIVLTYDDAIKSQLEIAIPQLNKHKLKGTFFLDGRISENEVAAWKSASDKGHELANHSLYHPCSEKAYKNHPRLYSENYDVVSMLSEIRMMNKILFMIDGKRDRTYAYPCTETSVGGRDYADTLSAVKLFKYARIGGNQNSIITDTKNLDYLRIPSFGVAQGETGASLIEYAEKVTRAGGVGVLMFHGVGGDYITVSAEEHEKFLQYLTTHQKDIWVAPFKEVMDFISQNTR
jgi:peptidoglycan/xylan/chitin deacetylase (PgdA/CDA1 family)